MNDFKRGELANAVALHDFDMKAVDAKGWFGFIEQWFADYNLEPTKMSIGGSDAIRVKGNRNIKFGTGKKRLEKNDYQGVTALWVAALPPDEYVNFEMSDFFFYAYIDDFFQGQCILCWDDLIFPYDLDAITKLVKGIYNFVKPKYGYVYQRPFKLGPGFYPAGIIQGLKYGDKERDEITNWGVIYDKEDPMYKPYMIRDVYPLNFLSEKHLSGPVEGQSLRDWIARDKSRGVLEEIIPGFWSWRVDPAHIEDIRSVLKRNEILISFLDRDAFYRQQG